MEMLQTSCGISLAGSTKGIADFMADKIMIMSYRMGLCGCRLMPVWAAELQITLGLECPVVFRFQSVVSTRS